jgi:hypothetical protein
MAEPGGGAETTAVKVPLALPEHYPAHAIHLVRTAMQVNVTLSQMADQKASILMGATFVVFTISVGQVSRGEYPYALLVLAVSAFISAFCAVVAVLPSIRPPPAAAPGTENILFFGVFSQLGEEEFTERVLGSMDTDEQIFRTMLRDIYQNGQVLQRKKYKFLGLAYRIFLGGLTLTLLTFIWESRDAVLAIF